MLIWKLIWNFLLRNTERAFLLNTSSNSSLNSFTYIANFIPLCRHVHPYGSGTYVVKGAWIGRIIRVNFLLILTILSLLFNSSVTWIWRFSFPMVPPVLLKMHLNWLGMAILFQIPKRQVPVALFMNIYLSILCSTMMRTVESIILRCLSRVSTAILFWFLRIVTLCNVVKTLGRKLFRRAKWLQGAFHPSRKKCVCTLKFNPEKCILLFSLPPHPKCLDHYWSHPCWRWSRLDSYNQCGK